MFVKKGGVLVKGGNARVRLVVRAQSGGKNVLVIGGTGRVGSSTAAALLKAQPELNITLAGRTEGRAKDAKAARPLLKDCSYEYLDIEKPETLTKALTKQKYDLVIHTAGPFQRREKCTVLEAAIETGTPYIDVCDDVDYSKRTRALHDRAVRAGVPCITTTGIYPGVSNIMAAHTISLVRKDYARPEDGPLAPEEVGTGGNPKRVLFSYFTAGTGGAGPTILASTFLLAGEAVTAYKDDQKLTFTALAERRGVDFGPGVGRRAVYLYNLPEVDTIHDVLKVPSISTRFGTDPEPWNWAMWLLARVAPKSLLASPEAVQPLVALISPLVRLVDAVVGQTVAMKVEVEFDNGKSSAALFTHRKLSDSVGTCTAAFARTVLKGAARPGVWVPEQTEAVPDRKDLLLMASDGVSRLSVNRPAWELEDEPKQIGMGFYWGIPLVLSVARLIGSSVPA